MPTGSGSEIVATRAIGARVALLAKVSNRPPQVPQSR